MKLSFSRKRTEVLLGREEVGFDEGRDTAALTAVAISVQIREENTLWGRDQMVKECEKRGQRLGISGLLKIEWWRAI